MNPKLDDKTLRELDCWLVENLFGWTRGMNGYGEPCFYVGRHEQELDSVPHYTTDPAAAMEVLKRCAEKNVSITIQPIVNPTTSVRWVCETQIAETVELAIALFAKILFSK